MLMGCLIGRGLCDFGGCGDGAIGGYVQLVSFVFVWGREC